MNEYVKEQEVQLEGVLEKIVFRSDDTGYVVGRITSKQQSQPITVTGVLSGVNIGEYLQMKGRWELHPEYGQQFKVTSYQTEQPVTVEGIVKYLSGSLIKGIGPKTAKKIVKVWGVDTLDIIELNPERLTEIDGIGKAKKDLITKGWQEQKSIKNLMMFLHSNDITVTMAQKIYKQYGEQAYQIIKANPYQLAADIYGIGFLTADKIALKLGLSRTSPQRIEASLLHLLSSGAEEGDCYVEVIKIIEVCRNLLHSKDTAKSPDNLEPDSGFTNNQIALRLLMMAERRQVIITKKNAAADSIINDSFTDEQITSSPDYVVYHPAYYYAEINSADKLNSLHSHPQQALHLFRDIDWEKAYSWLLDKEKIAYSDEQKEAIKDCLISKVSILTGGPGTGKSTITAALVKLAEAKKKRVLLAAPTGRAAKRLSEVTKSDAQTIHRLLEFSWQEGLKFKRNEENPLEADLIIIDEASMLDILLLNHLLKAVRLDTHLIFIGDVDQLPSVGAGSVLKDLIEARKLPVIFLHKIFRQSEDSYIITNAHRIKSGFMPLFSQEKGDFFFFGAATPEKAARMVIELVTERIPRNFGYSPFNDIQVLAPMHKGIVGIGELNRLLQETLNPNQNEEKEIRIGSKIFRVKDRIIQLKNNYEKEVFNGDFGYITAINKEMQTVTIEFEGNKSGGDTSKVDYEFSEMDQITHSYAISIHKSQGSEFPVVVIPLTTQHYIMLQRNLLYTAVSRAKKMVVIVGTQPAIGIALKNNKTIHRNTRLKSLIQIM